MDREKVRNRAGCWLFSTHFLCRKNFVPAEFSGRCISFARFVKYRFENFARIV